MTEEIACARNTGCSCGKDGYFCDGCPTKPITYTGMNWDYSNDMNLIKVIGFQACPVCFGTGVSQNSGTYSTVPTCTVCNGKKIISTITGQPPQ